MGYRPVEIRVKQIGRWTWHAVIVHHDDGLPEEECPTHGWDGPERDAMGRAGRVDGPHARAGLPEGAEGGRRRDVAGAAVRGAPFTSCRLRATFWHDGVPYVGLFLRTRGGSGYRVDQVTKTPSGWRLDVTRWPVEEIPKDAPVASWVWSDR